MSFNNVDIDYVVGIGWVVDPDDYTVKELINGDVTFCGSELEAVEYYANYNHLISSEDELSERFDDEVIPSLRDAWLEYSDYPDYPMISVEFSNFVDGLVSGGELHEQQMSDYSYVGRYKNES